METIHSTNMDLTLRDMLSNRSRNCPICNYKASCTCKYHSHIENHADPLNKTIFKCFFCDQRVTTLVRLREHMFVHSDDSEKLKCFVCNVFCKSEVAFNDHLWLHQSLDKKQTFRCIYCTHETYSDSTMKMHVLKHKNYIAVQECCLCHYKSKSRGDLLRHFATHKESPNSTILICNLCEYKTKHLSALRLHLSIHNDKSEVIKCSVCDYECHSKVDLSKHFLIHKDQLKFNSFKCSFCNYTTGYLREFRLHIFEHNSSPSNTKSCMCFTDSYKNYLKGLEETPKNPPVRVVSTINNPVIEQFLQNISSNDELLDKLKAKSLEQSALLNTPRNDDTSVPKQNKVPRKGKYKCDQCSFSTMNKRSFKPHMETHKDRSERKLFECTTCGATYTTRSSLKQHALRHLDPDERPMLHCDQCKYKTLHRGHLNLHIRTQHLSKTKLLLESTLSEVKKVKDSCEDGQQTEVEHTSAENDTGTESLETPKYKCDECSFTTVKRKNLKYHKETHKDRSERQLYACSICSATFTIKYSLKRHTLQHMEDYKTNFRGRSNKAVRSVLLKEMKLEFEPTEAQLKKLEGRTRQCEECPFTTTHKRTFMRHQETHKDRSERTLFACETCGATFTTQSSLKQHSLLHLDPNERPMFCCDLCDFKTLYKGCLSDHIKLKHPDGVKLECKSSQGSKYHCPKCSFSTKYLHSFKRHKEGHKDAMERKLFHCAICGASFMSKRSLKEHSWLHMDPEERPMMRCELCEYQTLYRSHFNKHIKIKHAQDFQTNVKVEYTESEEKQPECFE